MLGVKLQNLRSAQKVTLSLISIQLAIIPGDVQKPLIHKGHENTTKA